MRVEGEVQLQPTVDHLGREKLREDLNTYLGKGDEGHLLMVVGDTIEDGEGGQGDPVAIDLDEGGSRLAVGNSGV